jgi:hypothetical protein
MGNLKVKAFIVGKMDKLIRENGEKEKDMELVHGKVLMDKPMKVNGGTANQTAQASLQAMVIPMKGNLSNH